MQVASLHSHGLRFEPPNLSAMMSIINLWGNACQKSKRLHELSVAGTGNDEHEVLASGNYVVLILRLVCCTWVFSQAGVGAHQVSLALFTGRGLLSCQVYLQEFSSVPWVASARLELQKWASA